MGLLANVTSGAKRRPLRMLIHGVPKVGKSSLVAGAPAPLFLDAEQGTLDLDVARLNVTHWGTFLDALRDLLREPHGYQSVVLDTLDSLERLLCEFVCQTADTDSIEKVGGGFGKGWQRCAEEWASVGRLLARLQSERGMNVFALAHSEVATFNDPSGTDYSHWNMRLHKKSLAFWRGWVDDILFAVCEVQTEKKSKKPDQRRSGRRYLVTAWRPGIEAGNRSGLPPEVDLSWAALEGALQASGRISDTTPDELPGVTRAIQRARDAIEALRGAGADMQADRAQVWLDGDADRSENALAAGVDFLMGVLKEIDACPGHEAWEPAPKGGLKCVACPFERADDEPPEDEFEPAESMADAMDVAEEDLPF